MFKPYSFAGRSPFETRQTPGLPPAPVLSGTVEVKDGVVLFNGIPLPKVNERTSNIFTPLGAPAQPAPTQSPDRTVIRGELLVTPFVATNVNPIKVRDGETRSYLFIQNQAAINQMVVGFGQPPGPAGGIPVNGLIIQPNMGFYEMLVFVTQQPIWILGSAAATPGVILHAK